jgi:hypothetical protein
MSYISKTYKDYAGVLVGDGQCVAYVKAASGAPATSTWRRGARVKGVTGLAAGTAVATFSANGQYENVTGRSHAAIVVRVESGGIQVWDQWIGHPVAERFIRFDNASGGGSNDGDGFYVID